MIISSMQVVSWYNSLPHCVPVGSTEEASKHLRRFGADIFQVDTSRSSDPLKVKYFQNKMSFLSNISCHDVSYSVKFMVPIDDKFKIN